MKDIKLKEINKDISTLDKNETLQRFIKQKDVKEKSRHAEQVSSESSDPVKSATHAVIVREKKTVVESAYMAKRYAHKIKKENPDIANRSAAWKAAKHELGVKEKHVKISDKNTAEAFASIKTKEKEKAVNTAITRLKAERRKTAEPVSKPIYKKIKTGKEKNISLKQVQLRSGNKINYQTRMHVLQIQKYKQRVKALQGNATLKKGMDYLGTGLKHTFQVAKVATTSIQNVIGIGCAFILLVVIALFFGVFSALADDSSVNSAMQPVSSEVLAYADTISKYAKEYGIEGYAGLIQAVMMQESGGKGQDPMQSSECEYNTKYPKEPNGITDPDYSIKAGIHYLSDTIKAADVKNPTDIQQLSLALQAYNYGKGYIEWAKTNFGGYTRANAKVYSDQKKAELKTNVYGDPQYVAHVMQYYHIGNHDIVQIAQSQLGNIGGRPYWSWYGFNSRVEWCACFVSWVMNEAGLIENGSVPKFAYCPTGVNWFKEHNRWQERQYTPAAGDIIFFDWQNDGVSDHVGIVEKVEKGTIYTIEGNSTNDECRQNSYQIGSIYIAGYGVLKE